MYSPLLFLLMYDFVLTCIWAVTEFGLTWWDDKHLVWDKVDPVLCGVTVCVTNVDDSPHVQVLQVFPASPWQHTQGSRAHGFTVRHSCSLLLGWRIWWQMQCHKMHSTRMLLRARSMPVCLWLAQDEDRLWELRVEGLNPDSPFLL